MVGVKACTTVYMYNSIQSKQKQILNSSLNQTSTGTVTEVIICFS